MTRAWRLDVRTGGLPTLVALLLPSLAVKQHWIPASALFYARGVVERFDALGAFICVVIVGSLCGLSRRMLLAGILRLWMPLLLASAAAIATGTLGGMVAGASLREVLLRTLVPAMAGGLTAGVLPLAVGYASVFNTSSGAELALMLPAVVLANLAAVLAAAVLATRQSAKRGEVAAPAAFARTFVPDAPRVGGPTAGAALAALALLAAVYLCGAGAERLLGLPRPLVILVVAAALRLLCPMPPSVSDAAAAVYRGCIRIFTYPLLLMVGLLLMPWQSLVDGLKLSHLAALGCAVTTLAVVGGFAGRWVALPSADSALIAITRLAMGGSGDVAILSAARRLDLMPFAQMATRIGGALTLALALALTANG